MVILRQPLDRETQDLVEVIISITDEGIAGSEPNTVSLRREISILDENDNIPEFHNRPYSANISESTPIGSNLVVSRDIIVTDNDGGVNSDVNISCFIEPNMMYIDDVCETFNVWTEKVSVTSLYSLGQIEKNLNEKRILFVPSQLGLPENEYFIYFWASLYCENILKRDIVF